MSEHGLAARWFDGHSSRARDVRIDKVGDTLRLIDAQGEAVLWPLDEILINPRLGSTPRILRRRGHGHLETADAPELALWFPRPPSRIEGFVDFLERRRSAMVMAALMTVGLAVGFVHWGVPWIAQRAAERIPERVERQLSDKVVSIFDRRYFRPTNVDSTRRRGLQQAFAAMVSGEPRAKNMRLTFVDAPRLGANAFCLPDGRIYMTDELVQLGGSDEELLSVFAHEAGHYVHRHGMRSAIESSSALLAMGLLVGDVSGSSLAVVLPTVLLDGRFSRGHEREADAYALDLLRRTGYSPRAFATMMTRLEERAPDGRDKGPMDYFSSHPRTQERIDAAERAAEQ